MGRGAGSVCAADDLEDEFEFFGGGLEMLPGGVGEEDLEGLFARDGECIGMTGLLFEIWVGGG